MWKNNKYYFIIGFAILALGYIESNKPKPISWFESYSKYDKIPYGNYILFNELNSIFNKGITTTRLSVAKTLRDGTEAVNYLFINNSFYIESEEVTNLLDFVSQGNNACVIGRNISSELLEALNVSINESLTIDIQDSIKLSILENKTNYNFSYSKTSVTRYFDDTYNTTYKCLGVISDSLHNFIQVDYGLGRFYLHLNPRMFTNIHMLHNNNHKYVSAVLSHLPNETTLWDEFYKNRNSAIIKSPLAEVLSTNGLRQALYITMISLLVYMIFAIKRRQRIIPVLNPKLNDTIEFTKTVSQLYYNTNNNKDIGVKRMEYFLAHIRKRYNISTSQLDADFCDKLHTFSRVSKTDITQLVENFNIIKGVKDITNERIIQQDKLIERFYKKTK